MAWPQTVSINGAQWHRESCSDGFVYRVPSIMNPHVTIHNVTADDFEWWLRNGEFHLRYSSAGGLWEYQRGDANPFTSTAGRKTTNRGGSEEPQANALAKDFWTAMRGF
jgi:hypothetical protein